MINLSQHLDQSSAKLYSVFLNGMI